ncbi:hypothetical protein F5879DRAFT_1024739 [Lentinula edodes]|nr:hypothetical protein F5879DRAFT_1024739 [Lentinula edodes]
MSRSLWARNIDSEGSTQFALSNDICITNVALGVESIIYERTSLTLMTLSPGVVSPQLTIGSLMLDCTDQLSIQLWLEKGKTYILRVRGPNPVSILGYSYNEHNDVLRNNTTSLKNLIGNSLDSESIDGTSASMATHEPPSHSVNVPTIPLEMSNLEFNAGTKGTVFRAKMNRFSLFKPSLASQRSVVELDQQQILDVQKKTNDCQQRVTDIFEEHSRLREQYFKLIEERKDLWREDTKLESLVGRAADKMRTAASLDKETGIGLRAVDKIAERHRLAGVYGPLYRSFESTDYEFNIAIELTARNSDESASKVLDVILPDKTGRVTFMPIIRPASAFQQVFGQTCVYKYLTVAAANVKSHGINPITLDGDKVDRKGALTGGFQIENWVGAFSVAEGKYRHTLTSKQSQSQ